MKTLIVGLGLFACIGLAACAGATDDGDSSASAASVTSDLVGSWTVEAAEPGSAHVPHVPFRTIAGIVLRADGSAYAQLATRLVAGEHFVDDAHMIGMRDGTEVSGAWQGVETTWSVRDGGRELVLARPNAQPALVLGVTRTGKTLALTDPTYAGTQRGKADTLHAVANDCRLTAVKKTADEIAVDVMAASVFGFGQSPHAVLSTSLDLVGVSGTATTCAFIDRGAAETSGHFTWTDKATGALRAIQSKWTEGRSERLSVTSSQIYLYGPSGALRLVMTTIEENDLGGTAVMDLPSRSLRQERTYFDAQGQRGRSFVQPRLDAAEVVTEDVALAGRRIKDAMTEPVDVVDMPLCVSKPVTLIAKDPKDPAASLAAAPVCRAL